MRAQAQFSRFAQTDVEGTNFDDFCIFKRFLTCFVQNRSFCANSDKLCPRIPRHSEAFRGISFDTVFCKNDQILHTQSARFISLAYHFSQMCSILTTKSPRMFTYADKFRGIPKHSQNQKNISCCLKLNISACFDQHIGLQALILAVLA